MSSSIKNKEIPQKFLGLDNQCPMCLKILNSKRYLQKHLYFNKKRCSAPEGYIPPKIDYDKQIIMWEDNPIKSPVQPTVNNQRTQENESSVSKTDKPRRKNLLIAPPPTNIRLINENKIQENPTKSSNSKRKTREPHTTEKTKTPEIIQQKTSSVPKHNVKPKIQMRKQQDKIRDPLPTTTENTNTVTNRYTIAVDTNGNIVNLPNMQTQNDILKDNPALLEQVKQIVKNLNIHNGDGYKLPPEVNRCQKKIENILDEFGDVNSIINCGLKQDLNLIDTIISINSDDENNNVYIERISIPEDLRKDVGRDLSFVEIIYRGLYYILTNLISHKFYYFEMTRSKKAYDDCNKIMKYRKMVLISYVVLKRRLDKMFILKGTNNEMATKLASMHDEYYKNITASHLPYVHQYDNCMLVKLQMAAKLTTIELQSLNNFYENFSHLINIYEFKQLINSACSTLVEKNHLELTEAEVKRRPDYKYINVDKLSIEHKSFPDYDFEIISRDFCSHLVKITPMTFNRKVKYDHVDHYYKRIYIDNSSEAPLDEIEYQQLLDYY